jgi:hypothetical protein
MVYLLFVILHDCWFLHSLSSHLILIFGGDGEVGYPCRASPRGQGSPKGPGGPPGGRGYGKPTDREGRAGAPARSDGPLLGMGMSPASRGKGCQAGREPMRLWSGRALARPPDQGLLVPGWSDLLASSARSLG